MAHSFAYPNFLCLVSTHSPHIVGATELWLHDNIHDSEITPTGFTVFRTDWQRGKGEGVALFLQSDLQFSVHPSPPDTESVSGRLPETREKSGIPDFSRANNSSIIDYLSYSF